MNRAIFYSLIFLIAGALFASPALAADITFSCDSDNSDCSLSNSDPVFDVDDFLPGTTVVKSVEFKNNSSVDSCDYYIRLSDRSVQPDDFDSKFFTAVRDSDDNDKYGETDGDTAKDDKKLHDLFGGSEVDKIDTLSANSAKEYDWLVTFDSCPASYRCLASESQRAPADLAK